MRCTKRSPKRSIVSAIRSISVASRPVPIMTTGASYMTYRTPLVAAVLLAVLGAGVAIGRAQTRPDPGLPGYLHYTPADLDAIQRSLVPRMNALKQSAEQLADFGNHT